MSDNKGHYRYDVEAGEVRWDPEPCLWLRARHQLESWVGWRGVRTPTDAELRLSVVHLQNRLEVTEMRLDQLEDSDG